MSTAQLGPKAPLRHELDAAGMDAGVEYEETSRSDEEPFEDIQIPFDPRQIDVTTEIRSLDSLMKRLANGQIDLDPDFQRMRGIWDRRRKSQLIESLLLRIPLPTFYVAELSEEEGDSELQLGEDRWAVVDGIQRLSTIAQFVMPKVLDQPPLRLTGLEYLDENERTFEQLSPALQLRILESQFTMQVIRKSTPEAVKLNIFARINTGGVPLSAQELRHALTPGQARRFLQELAQTDEFQTAVSHSVKPSRMADREMVLRYLAFRRVDLPVYSEQDFDAFLRQEMIHLNRQDASTLDQLRSEFLVVMRVAAEIFGDDAFRKRYSIKDGRRPVSKALFEAIGVALATIGNRYGPNAYSVLTEHRDDVKAGFMELMADQRFDRSISQGTGDPYKVRYRIDNTVHMLSEIVDGKRYR
jgi:hypothetical protein